MTFTMSLPYVAFASDYSTANASTTLDYLADYYYDSTGTYTNRDKNTISIVFTSDINSNFDKLAKISTFAYNRTDKYPLSYLFDAGNYSMGAPYNIIFESQAAELSTMGGAGYDATTIGNSELSHGASGLASMLTTAANSGNTVPAVVATNLKVSGALKKAFTKYGVKDYKVVNKYGKKIAVFGIIGKDSFDSANAKGVTLEDPEDSAKAAVAEIQKTEKDVDMIVCLANTGNGGADSEQSEAVKIAKNTSGINLIICGNSTAALSQPIEENGTEIVSAGQNGDKAGAITFKLSGSKYKMTSYKITNINGSIADDATVTAMAANYKNKLNSYYFSNYGFTYSQKLTTSNYDFTSVSSFGTSKADDPLANLITDSYLYTANKSGVNADVSIMSAGSISDTISSGKVTAEDAYNVLSKGIGTDDKAGYPLVKFYLNGSELKAVAEAGSSTSKADKASRLYLGGLTYTYNPHRVFTNKVYDAKLTSGNTAINDKTSYCVVTDINTAKKLSSIVSKHHMSITLKNKGGSKISNIASQTIYKGNGQEVKAWSGLATYLKSFGSTIPSKYGSTDGRIVYDSSFNPAHLIKQPNKMFSIMIAIAIIVIAAIILLIVLLVGGFGRNRYGRSGKRRRNYYPKQKKQRPIFSNKR